MSNEHARVTTWTFEPTPEQVDAFIRRGRDEVMSAARQLPGSQAFVWLVDREQGSGLALTLWADAEPEQASAPPRDLRMTPSLRCIVCHGGFDFAAHEATLVLCSLEGALRLG